MLQIPLYLLRRACPLGRLFTGLRAIHSTVLRTRAGLAFRGYNVFTMRRLIAIAAFALSLTVSVWAQHGGGGGGHGGGGFGGGHAGGFSGGGHASGFSGHSGGFSGSHSSPSVHAYSGPLSSASPHSFSGNSFSGNSRFSQGNSSRGPYLHNGFNFHINTYNRYGYWGRYGYPWWGWGWPWGYYDPSWWWNDDSYNNNGSSTNYDYGQNVADAAQMNQQNLEEQRMFRQEEADGDQDAYAPSYRAPRAAAGDADHPVAMMPNTVLVFRDQHKEEVANYAIVGQTLWNFAPQHTEKISIADLDLPATTKANADRGVTFRLPVPGEAQ
jgi:hypothetical protein